MKMNRYSIGYITGVVAIMVSVLWLNWPWWAATPLAIFIAAVGLCIASRFAE